MARSFTTIPTANYIGQFYRVPMNLGGPIGGRSNHAVPLSINWNTYFALLPGSPPSIGVNVNLAQGQSGAGAILQRIQSVYLDNTGSLIPAYVTFPDTGFTIVAAPDTAGWYPVITNQLTLQVFALGISSATVSTLKLFVTDAFVPPYSDTELALVTPEFIGSPTIQRSGTITPGFGPPALGDQMWSTPLLLAANTGLNQSLAIMGAPYSSGFLYITSIVMSALGLTINITASAEILPIFQIATALNTNVLYEFVLPVLTTNGTAGFGTTFNEFFNQNGMNIRLDATKTWLLLDKSVYIGASQKWASGAANPCSLYANIAYTYNAN